MPIYLCPSGVRDGFHATNDPEDKCPDCLQAFRGHPDVTVEFRRAFEAWQVKLARKMRLEIEKVRKGRKGRKGEVDFGDGWV